MCGARRNATESQEATKERKLQPLWQMRQPLQLQRWRIFSLDARKWENKSQLRRHGSSSKIKVRAKRNVLQLFVKCSKGEDMRGTTLVGRTPTTGSPVTRNEQSEEGTKNNR